MVPIKAQLCWCAEWLILLCENLWQFPLLLRYIETMIKLKQNGAPDAPLAEFIASLISSFWRDDF